ncbi:hypothetical protein Bbelb_356910 [Branchiostoma belcheri]|nr:hypothetical protein Bbelb_356910 [Branchiostoma belcheri]
MTRKPAAYDFQLCQSRPDYLETRADGVHGVIWHAGRGYWKWNRRLCLEDILLAVMALPIGLDRPAFRTARNPLLLPVWKVLQLFIFLMWSVYVLAILARELVSFERIKFLFNRSHIQPTRQTSGALDK